MNTKREWAHKEHVLRELDVQLDFLSRELAEVKLEQGKVHAAMERAMFQSACSEQVRPTVMYELIAISCSLVHCAYRHEQAMITDHARSSIPLWVHLPHSTFGAHVLSWKGVLGQ